MNLSKKKKKRKHKMGEGGSSDPPRPPLDPPMLQGAHEIMSPCLLNLCRGTQLIFSSKTGCLHLEKKMRFLLIRWFEFYLYNRAAIFAIHANYGIWVLLFRVKLTNLKWGIWSNLGKLQLKVKPHTRNVVSKVMVVTDLKLIKGLSVKLKQYLQENIYLG